MLILIKECFQFITIVFIDCKRRVSRRCFYQKPPKATQNYQQINAKPNSKLLKNNNYTLFITKNHSKITPKLHQNQ